MRVVVVVIAALMTLGLAAFGIVAAQKSNGQNSLVVLAAHMISPAKTRPRQRTPPSRARPVQKPVIQVSEITTTARCVRPRQRRQSSPRTAPRPAPQARRRLPSPRRQRRTPAIRHSALQQSGCARPLACRRNRHHWRPRLRYRALQAVRLPARQRGGADFRRRAVAGQHAEGAQGTHRQLHQGDVL